MSIENFNDLNLDQRHKDALSMEGISEQQLSIHLNKIKAGNPVIELVAPCTVGDGIVRMDPLTQDTCVQYFKDHFKIHDITFLIPASGSGSRMFKDIYTFLESEEESGAIQTLKEHFNDFPFSELLDEDLPEYHSEEHFKLMLKKMLNEAGLNFGNSPKALIPFHKYKNHIKTPLEEHVIMSLNIMNLDAPKLHFTLQKEHCENVEEKLHYLYQTDKLDFSYGISFQDKETDAIAFDEQDDFLDVNGHVMRRPAGHGALLGNLNQLDTSIVFIRNIDNVQHEEHARKSVMTRQMLGGFLMRKVEQVHKMLNALHNGEADLGKIKSWLSNNFDVDLKPDGQMEQKQQIIDFLNRPIRVCGMVKNTGLPGGGPFWVKSKNGRVSRQIIEKAQVSGTKEQKSVFEKATHFNPVEIVGYLKDFRGEKFDLMNYRDESQYFLVEKHQKDKKIKYSEQPGLWNGSMAEWLTYFVEIPSEVFSPVKTFTDLLNPFHRSKNF